MSEKILTTIYGINKSVKAGRPGVYGVGVIADTENTLILTDRRILFIAVPVNGEGLSLGGADVSGLHSIFNKKGIEKTGSEMLRKMNLQQILRFNPANFEIPLESVSEVKMGWFGTMKIIDANGKKYRYTIRKHDRDQLKKFLQGLIPERVR